MTETTTIFLGPQGSGKGTHASLFEAHLKEIDSERKVVHFEMGKNLRELAAKDIYTAHLMRDIIARGELVPFTLSTCVFSQYLIDHLEGNEHLIIDGFPRSESQLEVINSAMEFYKRELPTIFYIQISDEEGIKRLLKRGRADDTEEGIKKRLSWSREEWAKIRAHLVSSTQYRLIEINGDQTIEQVQAEIRSHFHFS